MSCLQFCIADRPRCFPGAYVGFLASPAALDVDWCKREGKMDGDCLVLAVGTPGESCSVVPYLSETSQIANGSSPLDSDVEKLHRD